MATKEENERIRAGFAAFKKRQAQDRGFTPSAISRQVKLVASANDVSVPKSALDNFLSTYKNVKFGPLQRAIAKFIDSLKSGTPAKPKSVTSTDTRTSPADRFKGLADTQKEAQKNRQPTPKATGKPGPRKKTTVTAAAQEKAAREATRKKKTKDTRKGPVQASSGRFKPVVGVGETGPDKSMPKKTRPTKPKPPGKRAGVEDKETVRQKQTQTKITATGKPGPKRSKLPGGKPGPKRGKLPGGKPGPKPGGRGGKVTAKRINPAMKERGKAFQGSYDPKTEVLRNVTVNGKRKTMVFPKKKKS